jgi:hypothetical protein
MTRNRRRSGAARGSQSGVSFLIRSPNLNLCRLPNIKGIYWLHHRPFRPLPVTESVALPARSKVECNDRLPSCNPTVRDSATPLPKMPGAHEVCAHLAGAYRIWTSHVRLLQMRSRRTNRDTVRSDEIRCCWLVHRRITSADVRPPQLTASFVSNPTKCHRRRSILAKHHSVVAAGCTQAAREAWHHPDDER